MRGSSRAAVAEGRQSFETALTTGDPAVLADELFAVTALLDECAGAVGGEVALHSCASGLPWKLLQRSMISAVSVDVETLTAADLDGIGEFVDSGRTVLLGAVPARPAGPKPSPQQIAASVAGITDRLGFARAVLRDRIGISPACGLAAATAAWARAAIELAQKAVDGMAEDPDGI